MKYLWFLGASLLFQTGQAQALTVTGIKVSVTASSAAAAREQALDQAHGLAFQKLMKENFPEKEGPPPSQDALMNMVTTFSIDREKTTPTSYTASLTFQFDDAKVQAWGQQEDLSPSSPSLPPDPLPERKRPLLLTASYTTLSEWQHIKRALETGSGVQKVTVLAFSPQKAEVEVICGGDVGKLQHLLLQQGLSLSSQGGRWVLSSKSFP